MNNMNRKMYEQLIEALEYFDIGVHKTDDDDDCGNWKSIYFNGSDRTSLGIGMSMHLFFNSKYEFEGGAAFDEAGGKTLHIGRYNRPGWKNEHMRKLTATDVVKIRESTATNKALGEKYGVSAQTISLIKQRKAWRWLT